MIKRGGTSVVDVTGTNDDIMAKSLGYDIEWDVRSPLPLSKNLARATEFNGTDDSFTVAASDDFTFTDGFTFETWVKLDNTSGTQTFISRWGPGTDEQSFHVGQTDGKLRFGLHDGASAPYIQTLTAVIAAGGWTHVAAAYDGDFMRLYVNGQEQIVDDTASYTGVGYDVSAESPAFTWSDPAEDIVIGDNSGNDQWVYGLMADMRLWNEAREDYQIQYSMDGHVESCCQNLVANWHLDGSTDGNAVDELNGNTGVYSSTVNGGPQVVNNAPPVVITGPSAEVETDMGTALRGKVVASGQNGDILTYSVLTDASSGAVTVNSDGSFKYEPDGNYCGLDSFTVKVADHNGGVTNQTVVVSVYADNDDVIVGDNASLSAGPSRYASLYGVSKGDDGDVLTGEDSVPTSVSFLESGHDTIAGFSALEDMLGFDHFLNSFSTNSPIILDTNRGPASTAATGLDGVNFALNNANAAGGVIPSMIDKSGDLTGNTDGDNFNDGAAANDTVSFHKSSTIVVLDLSSGGTNLRQSDGTDSLQDIEAVEGSDQADILTDGAADRFIYESTDLTADIDQISDFDAGANGTPVGILDVSYIISGQPLLFLSNSSNETLSSGGPGYEAQSNNNTKIIDMDTDSDQVAKMSVQLDNVVANNLDDGDFNVGSGGG
jgi:hypothetical protein